MTPNTQQSLVDRVVLRPVAMPEDDDFLRELYFHSRTDLDGVDMPEDLKRNFLLMQHNLQTEAYAKDYPDASHDIVEYDDDRIGRLMVDRRSDSICVVDISLLPTKRNIGIGTFLLQRLIDECAEKKIVCNLQVLTSNRAQMLYHRLGFKVFGNDGLRLSMRWKADSTMETFNRDAFAEVIGSTFKLPASDDRVLDLELIEVSRLTKTAFQQSFCVTFLLQEGYNAPQGLYDMSHEKLGAMQLFLVPIGSKEGRLRLEAVFNLVLEKETES